MNARLFDYLTPDTLAGIVADVITIDWEGERPDPAVVLMASMAGAQLVGLCGRAEANKLINEVMTLRVA